MPTRSNHPLTAIVAGLFSFTLMAAAQDSPLSPATSTPPEKQFAAICASCHGPTALGTDRGPALVESRTLRNRPQDEIRELIRNGTPGGMPPFPLPEDELRPLARWVHALNASAYDVGPAGDSAAGEQFFYGEGGCDSCHMIAGRGKANGPDLSDLARQLTLRDIEEALDQPNSRQPSGSSASMAIQHALAKRSGVGAALAAVYELA